jgi:hypothetical protein
VLHWGVDCAGGHFSLLVRFAESVVFCWLLSQNAGLNGEVQFNGLWRWGNFGKAGALQAIARRSLVLDRKSANLRELHRQLVVDMLVLA